MTHFDISNHMLNADQVIYTADDFGTLEYCYSFKIPDGADELTVLVPDSKVDDFLADYPKAY